MAHLAAIKTPERQLVTLPQSAGGEAAGPQFSPLEWSIIRLAHSDRLWTTRPAGRLRHLWNWLLARGNPQLANPRLETLRRTAVLSWHYGFMVSGDVVADFLSAGFTTDQYELLVSSISRARSGDIAIHPNEVLA